MNTFLGDWQHYEGKDVAAWLAAEWQWSSYGPIGASEVLRARAQLGTLLLAHYDLEGYEGSAFVLFRGQDGKLYEVNDYHCSCNGLRWHPEETTEAALLARMDDGSLGTDFRHENLFAVELRARLIAGLT